MSRHYVLFFFVYTSIFIVVQIYGQTLQVFKDINLENDNKNTIDYVPLKKVHIDATIYSFAADVTITQIFRNDENVSVEAVYYFPIEERAAVYSFVAHISGREIVAQLKEKAQAQRDYNAALQKGHGAYLLQEDEKSPDNFVISVGALLPATECTITIAYVTELNLLHGSIIQFVIPTTIARRYNSEQGGLTPPAVANLQYVQNAPYQLELTCRIEKIFGKNGQFISDVSSPSHTIAIDFTQEDAYFVTFNQEKIDLDRDILINIQLAKTHDNTILASEPGAVMVAFIPTDDVFRQVRGNNHANEFIFVVDCSGSMQSENKIGLTRKAILLFLKTLPTDSHFNIIRFGSDFKAIFPEITRINNKENVRQAKHIVDNMEADLGGTELLAPLQWLAKNPPRHDRSRQIFFLTDGQISDVLTVTNLCRSMATSTRIFSFGLGASPSRSLVKGIARSTNGHFVFIPPNSNVDIYVNEQMKKALQHSINDVQVIWNLGISDVHSAPTHLPTIYANDRVIAYGLSDDSTIEFDSNSSVRLFTRERRFMLGEARIDQKPSLAKHGLIKRLAAKALIIELQHEKERITETAQSRFEDEENSTKKIEDSNESRKKRITGLSLKHNILSVYTAFVAIETRINGNNTNMVLREVPIQRSADDRDHIYMFTVNRISSVSSTGNGCLSQTTIYWNVIVVLYPLLTLIST